MELEELKHKWELLCERLERDEAIRLGDLQRLLHGRMNSFVRYSQTMALVGMAVVPVCVAIGKFRGVPDTVIGVLMVIYAILFLPSLYGLRLLMRVARYDGTIVEQERRMTRYARFARRCTVYQYAGGGVLLAGVLAYASGYYTAHGMWWTVAAMLAVGIVVSVVVTRYEWARLCELRRRMQELREFEEQ